MQIEKLLEVAAEYKIAMLKADEMSIIGYHQIHNFEKDAFHIYDEEVFKQIIGNRPYKIRKRVTDELYDYTVKINDYHFFCVTEALLFEGDEKYVQV